MKKLIICLSIMCSIPVVAQFDFESHTIDQWGNRLGQTDLIDMDQDGDSDLVVGQSYPNGGEVVWYENSGSMWTRHSIGAGSTDVGGDAHDLDGDGWPEMWSGEILFKNLRNGTFSRHNIGATKNHDGVFCDIDGDGKMEALANWDQHGLSWYDIPEDPTQQWTEHMICPASELQIHGGVAPFGYGDIDGDGDLDVVSAWAWFEQITPYDWAMRVNIPWLGEPHKYGTAVRTVVIDMDHDGDLDVVQSECDNPDSQVAWYENNGCGHWDPRWIKKEGDFQDFHSLIVDNFDEDPAYEVISGGGPMSMAPNIYLWDEQPDGTWKEYIIAENHPAHETVAGDLDGDGDIDLYTKPWADGTDVIGEGTHYILENKSVSTTLPDTGWTYLFNGHDLTGWAQTGGAQRYYVENGCIVGESVEGVTDNAFLVHESSFDNFHLKFDVLLEDGDLNSGVQFRSYVASEYTELLLRYWDGGHYATIPLQEGRMYGYQAEIYKESSGYIYDEGRRSMVPAWWGTDNGSFIVGQWNQYEIICEGPIITTKINSQERITINDGLTLEGLIGLQVHGNTAGGLRVKWKNIRVKGEASTEPIPPDPPEEAFHYWGFNGNGEDPGGVTIDTFNQASYSEARPPEGSHYGFGEWGGHWESTDQVKMADEFTISFRAKVRGRNGDNEAVKTVLDMEGLRMLLVMGSVSDLPNKGKVAMQVWDHSQEDEERGLESYGNVITADQWVHVAITYKTGGDIMNDCGIFVDGRQVSTMTYSKMAYQWDQESIIRIGKSISGKFPLWGGIDDLMIFDHRKTAEEIQWMSENPGQVPE